MENELRDDIKFIDKFLYSIQKHRIGLFNWIDAKRRDGIEPSARTLKLYKAMEEQEAAAKRMAKDIVSLTAIWPEFFENISGVGECLAASLIAEIGDISRFPTVSSLWAYAALIAEYHKAKCANGHKLIVSSNKHKECPVFDNEEGDPCGGKMEYVEHVKGKAPKRVKGHHYLFNNRLKTICWKISEQMIKQGDQFYRDIYYKEKEKQLNQNPDIQLGHAHNRAKRKMVKMFLSNLWEAWRVCEKLEIKPPYAIEELGHQGYIQWADLKEMLREAKKKSKVHSEALLANTQYKDASHTSNDTH